MIMLRNKRKTAHVFNVRCGKMQMVEDIDE